VDRVVESLKKICPSATKRRATDEIGVPCCEVAGTPGVGSAFWNFALGLLSFRKNTGYQSGYFLEDEAEILHNLLINIGI